MKPAVRQAQRPVLGFLGWERHWEIWLGWVRVGEMRAWSDAVAVANIIAASRKATTEEPE